MPDPLVVDTVFTLPLDAPDVVLVPAAVPLLVDAALAAPLALPRSAHGLLVGIGAGVCVAEEGAGDGPPVLMAVRDELASEARSRDVGFEVGSCVRVWDVLAVRAHL